MSSLILSILIHIQRVSKDFCEKHLITQYPYEEPEWFEIINQAKITDPVRYQLYRNDPSLKRYFIPMSEGGFLLDDE